MRVGALVAMLATASLVQTEVELLPGRLPPPGRRAALAVSAAPRGGSIVASEEMSRDQLLTMALVGVSPMKGAKKDQAQALRKALSRGRQIIVSVQAGVDEAKVPELSAALREAGATALLAPPALVASVVAEQAGAKGQFPGPVPVLVDGDLSDTCDIDDATETCASVAGAVEAGAVGVVLHGDGDVDAVSAAAAANLATIVVAEGDGAADAVAAGAAAVLCKEPAQVEGTTALADWDGTEAGLRDLRTAGFRAALLRCDPAEDPGRCAAAVERFKNAAATGFEPHRL